MPSQRGRLAGGQSGRGPGQRLPGGVLLALAVPSYPGCSSVRWEPSSQEGHDLGVR